MKFIYEKLQENDSYGEGLAAAEWLETNGLGGWAASSISGAHSRRYHGLLVASISPPTERVVLLSKLDETIISNGGRTELGSNIYQGNTVHPKGYQYIESFSRGFFPQWDYKVENIRLRKTIGMVHHENTVLVKYEVIEAPSSFQLELLPLIAARAYHALNKAGSHIHWEASFENNIFHTRPDGVLELYISAPGARYQHSPRWFYDFHYKTELYRGLDHAEDLFNHGTFTVTLKEGDTFYMIISTGDPRDRSAEELFSKELQRKRALLKSKPEVKIVEQLVLAADQFIVNRGQDLKTIIAGYHWFTDWGRDTMISLPGLCLSTERFEDAKKILRAFAGSVSQGMLPNRFQDNGEAPEYNNVDGTLWYFIAIQKYLEETGDREFVLNELLPVLKEIIDWHFKGTRYNIHVADNGLLHAGEQGQQLTWMDARIGTWVVTPRMGFPVEIQALWYNAQRIFSHLLEMNGQKEDAMLVNISADKTKNSFLDKFWIEKKEYLYDVVDSSGLGDASLRPNQIFAISLPFPLLELEKAKKVLELVKRELLTPVGLRSLAANDMHYISVYGGDAWHRDSAYHEGTVWSWLLGPFIDAVMKTEGKKGLPIAKKIIEDFLYHLGEGCIGNVSEIFDAEPPHHPRGCIAQAWSVGEILRVIIEYKLDEPRKKKNISLDRIPS
jgi:predicted glycogen debranching enzyme